MMKFFDKVLYQEKELLNLKGLKKNLVKFYVQIRLVFADSVTNIIASLLLSMCILVSNYLWKLYRITDYFHELQIFTNAALLALAEIFHIHDPELTFSKDLRDFCSPLPSRD